MVRFTFRQRKRFVSPEERKSDAEGFRETCPKLAKLILDFSGTVTAEIKPEDRKSWSPRNPGREKGFSVRNASNIAKLLLK